MKRFWDTSYGGQGYDAVGRRKGAPAETPATIAPLSSGRTTAGLTASGTTGTRAGGRTPVGGHRAGSTQPNEAVQNLQNQLREMSTHLEGLEKERDFYFSKVIVSRYPVCRRDRTCTVADKNHSKLRDIEILVQSQLDVLEAEGKEDEVLKEIQKILYSTEVGHLLSLFTPF
jgi:microtubule-associated protein, RP/EB family